MVNTELTIYTTHIKYLPLLKYIYFFRKSCPVSPIKIMVNNDKVSYKRFVNDANSTANVHVIAKYLNYETTHV